MVASRDILLVELVFDAEDLKSCLQPPQLFLRHTPQDLTRCGEAWVLDGQYRGLSGRTVEDRKAVVRKLVWWTEHYSPEGVGTAEMKRFFQYVADGEPTGRWGLPQL